MTQMAQVKTDFSKNTLKIRVNPCNPCHLCSIPPDLSSYQKLCSKENDILA